MFFSKWLLRISSAWGVKEVLRLRFLEGSLPINSVRFCMPDLWRASASAIQRSRTGLIFWALLGVMSNFSNLAGYKRPGFSLPVRLLPIVFSWASCGRKKWLLRMVCLGRIEKKESYLGALPEQGISCLLNQNATGTELNGPAKLYSAPGTCTTSPVLRSSGPDMQYWSKEMLPIFKGPGEAQLTSSHKFCIHRGENTGTAAKYIQYFLK